MQAGSLQTLKENFYQDNKELRRIFWKIVRLYKEGKIGPNLAATYIGIMRNCVKIYGPSDICVKVIGKEITGKAIDPMSTLQSI